MSSCAFGIGEVRGGIDGEFFVCVRTCVVLLESTDKFTVDAYGTGDDGHDVLRKGTRFICTHDRSIGHGFARTEDSYEKLFVGHSFRGEG